MIKNKVSKLIQGEHLQKNIYINTSWFAHSVDILQETGRIIEKLDQEKVKADVKSIEGVEKRQHMPRCYQKYKHNRKTFKANKYR